MTEEKVLYTKQTTGSILEKQKATQRRTMLKVKVPTSDYVSSWRASTEEEKKRAKNIVKFRKELLGKTF
jgi:hypothetical protein